MKKKNFSRYVSVEDKVVAAENVASPSSFRAALFSLLSVLVVVMSLFSQAAPVKSASALDWGQWIMCNAVPQGDKIYQYTQTSEIPFKFRSKSTVVIGVDDVDSWMNQIISLGDNNGTFSERNVPIIGFNPNTSSGLGETDTDFAARYNKGDSVTPYERFGVAGLKFTGYQGEWKHLAVNACSDSDPVDPKAGLFYEDRLEPRSTWEDISASTDVRTQQFQKGIFGQFATAFNVTVANGVFTVAKFIVAITTALVSFSFSDVVSVMGIDSLIGGENGVFASLYQGVYLPLIVFAFLITGVVIMMNLLKGQARKSLSSAVSTIVMFCVALVIMAFPKTFVALPNQVVVVAQSMTLSIMNNTLYAGDDLCVEGGGVKDGVNLVSKDSDNPRVVLDQATENMQAVVGCQFWQMFLLKPWAQGQFGTDYNNLWATGKTPDWAAKGSGELGNTNGEMVGEAEVPLGGGRVMNNWAIYQISTQTNVHSPTGHPGEPSKFSMDVNNDWWRIVDAMANYEEKEVTDDISSGGSVSQIAYMVPKNNAPSPFWDTWVGNNSGQRVGSAITATVVAGFALSAPLFFSLMSSVYAIGTALLVTLAPIVLLFACWPGRGMEVFKAWGSTLISVMWKRFVTGMLLVISISVISVILTLTKDMSWWGIVLYMVIFSIVLYASRHRLFDALASAAPINTGGIGSSTQRVAQITSSGYKNIMKFGDVGVQGVVGGVTAKVRGDSFLSGAKYGAKNKLKNIGYTNGSRFSRVMMESYEQSKPNMLSTVNAEEGTRDYGECASCGVAMVLGRDETFFGGRDRNGRYICAECLKDGNVPDAVEVVFTPPSRSVDERQAAISESKRKLQKVLLGKFETKTSMEDKYSTGLKKQILEGKENGVPIDTKRRETLFEQYVNSLNHDINNHAHAVMGDGEASLSKTPKIPDDILPYISKDGVDLINRAWSTQNYDYITMVYVASYMRWYQDNVGAFENGTVEDMFVKIKQLGDTSRAKVKDTTEDKVSDPDGDGSLVDGDES